MIWFIDLKFCKYLKYKIQGDCFILPFFQHKPVFAQVCNDILSFRKSNKNVKMLDFFINTNLLNPTNLLDFFYYAAMPKFSVNNRNNLVICIPLLYCKFLNKWLWMHSKLFLECLREAQIIIKQVQLSVLVGILTRYHFTATWILYNSLIN